jgi:hypothetical protein
VKHRRIELLVIFGGGVYLTGKDGEGKHGGEIVEQSRGSKKTI